MLNALPSILSALLSTAIIPIESLISVIFQLLFAIMRKGNIKMDLGDIG
jgi:hypothetical protein